MGRSKRQKKNLATTYSPTENRSTIGEEAFHYRVRDGNECFHFSMVTRKFTLLVKPFNKLVN